MNKITTTILLAVALAPKAVIAAEAPRALANVIGSSAWSTMQSPPYGIYSFSIGDTPDVQLVATGVVPGNFGSVYADGRYFVIEGIATSASSFITNYIYDADTWTKITDFRGENITAFDMAWDETTGNVYGYFHNFDTGDEFFGTIDINSGRTTSIATLPFVAYGLGADVEGQLYAMANNGDFYRLDKASGATSLIASTGCESRWTTSGAVDSSTRSFYYATCGDTSTELYRVGLDDGKATLMHTIPDNMEFVGMYFPEATALPGAPARAEDFEMDFDKGALSGSVKFKIPATLFSGDKAEGKVTYKVTIGGKALATAEAGYGDNITVPITVDEVGMYDFNIVLGNATGSSPTLRESRWIGPDVPAPVGKVEITFDGNGEFTLTWPEATSLHGGWMDTAALTYIVKRYGESDATFTDITATTFTDKVSLPGEDEYATYHYNVAAAINGTPGSFTSSEYYTIGSKTPPFAEAFNARWDLGKFTIFEGEKKDNERWSYDSKAVTVTTSTVTGADDYLLLPPLLFEAGYIYDVTFDVKGKYASDTERIEMLAGMSPTAEGLTTMVMEPAEFKTADYIPMTATFRPDRSGLWFLALHAISDPNKGAITVDNIKVDAGISGVTLNGTDDTTATPRYFNLQGLKVKVPLSGGIYIELRGTTARKILVK